MNARVKNINPQVLRQCREQIGMSIEQAQSKASMSTLDKVEQGKRKPTFKQVDTL